MRRADGLVSVNMGQPQLDWAEVPLARAADTLHLPLPGDPVGVGMGNPHCVLFVPNAESADVAGEGPRLEHDPLYPEGTNVEFASLTAPDRIRMRVWERGTGITLACGSGACATAVAAHLRGLTGRRVTLDLDGGPMEIDWRDDGVWMTGPTAHVFDGGAHPGLPRGARMTGPVFATLGCRLNAYETEAMKEMSAAAGLGNAVIVNTCAVTAEAVRKAKPGNPPPAPRTSDGRR